MVDESKHGWWKRQRFSTNGWNISNWKMADEFILKNGPQNKKSKCFDVNFRFEIGWKYNPPTHHNTSKSWVGRVMNRGVDIIEWYMVIAKFSEKHLMARNSKSQKLFSFFLLFQLSHDGHDMARPAKHKIGKSLKPLNSEDGCCWKAHLLI